MYETRQYKSCTIFIVSEDRAGNRGYKVYNGLHFQTLGKLQLADRQCELVHSRILKIQSTCEGPLFTSNLLYLYFSTFPIALFFFFSTSALGVNSTFKPSCRLDVSRVKLFLLNINHSFFILLEKEDGNPMGINVNLKYAQSSIDNKFLKYIYVFIIYNNYSISKIMFFRYWQLTK